MAKTGRLGKFELTRQIGKGSTGKVYHGLDTFSGQEVAVKVVDQSVLSDPEFNDECRKQFLNEAALAGKLNHPHIVAIMEASVTEESGYVVMEYVPGGNLSQYTRPDTLLPVNNVLEIVFKCCGALDYAYRQGIVHRDLKPANIMVVSDTNIKLADFGAAYFYRAQATQAMSVGTPYYMSPEQIDGSRVSHLSDMYSLGVMFYVLLTGKQPFQASNMIDLFEVIRKKDPNPPSVGRADLPKALDDIVLRMIAKRPEDRYQNWADLALELSKVGQFSAYQKEVPDSEKFNIFRKLNDFRDFTDAEIWELVHVSKWYKRPAKTVILREGESGEIMYLIASGSAKVTKQGRLLDVLKAGECFGEMAYIQRGAPRHATVETLSDVVLAEFPFQALDGLSPGCELHFAKKLLRSLNERLVLTDNRIAATPG